MLSPAGPDLPGFEPVRALGKGASCQVWLMREREGLRRPVAVKLFHELAEWRRELEALRRVEEVRRESRCAGLVQSLATGESGGTGPREEKPLAGVAGVREKPLPAPAEES